MENYDIKLKNKSLVDNNQCLPELRLSSPSRIVKESPHSKTNIYIRETVTWYDKDRVPKK